ncbi:MULTISPECIES: hypothetical protein [Flavobacterium]|uniref:Uncharacterized protein n=1 Tax=Flavobacterium keumense TaxID=1306518 RepID=A0ABY8N3E2_9FLAO|nr:MULTISPECIES: hypothetical protein [Flavobacterium]WGK93779.1 hypothetical protein MG292_06660 [Flavobacterium keumense]
MEDNNHYSADKAQIQSNLMQLAGETLNDIVKSTESPVVGFLQSAYNFKKIRNRITEINFANVVGLMVTKIAALAGINGEIDMATKYDLLRYVKTRCSDISLEEIYKAFELERYNEYPTKSNHYQLFGTEYFSEVIKKYRVWKAENKTYHNISENRNAPQLMAISESQKNEIIHNGIKRVFIEYKQTKNITEPCAHIFDELLDMGLIIGANTPKLELYYNSKKEQAKKELEQELEIKKASSNFIQRKNIARDIEQVLQGNSSKIIVRTKKIVLKEYFDKLISTSIDIEFELKKITK